MEPPSSSNTSPVTTAGVYLDNLNDFIKPAIACTNPTVLKKSTILIQPDNISSSDMNSPSNKPIESVKINLADCLACSGCITSAETVLVGTHSLNSFLEKFSDSNQDTLRPTLIITLNNAIIPSLSNYFQEKNPIVVYNKISWLFHHKFQALQVIPLTLFQDLTLLAVAEEFVATLKNSPDTPLFTSACPGWVCYAEKILKSSVKKNISRVKSPQTLAGAYLKFKNPKIYHVSIQPCYDKKLEATKDSFTDLVLTTKELVDLLVELDLHWKDLKQRPTDIETNPHIWHGKSGGYLDFCFRYATHVLYPHLVSTLPPLNIPIPLVRKKNLDLAYASLKDENNKTVFTMVAAYGFRNIQTIIRKSKKKSVKFQFCELFACPRSCINGGGQIPLPNLKDIENLRFEQPIRIPYQSLDIVPIFGEKTSTNGNDEYIDTSLKRISSIVQTPPETIPKPFNFVLHFFSPEKIPHNPHQNRFILKSEWKSLFEFVYTPIIEKENNLFVDW